MVNYIFYSPQTKLLLSMMGTSIQNLEKFQSFLH